MLPGRAERAEIVDPKRIDGAENGSDLSLGLEVNDGGGFNDVRRWRSGEAHGGFLQGFWWLRAAALRHLPPPGESHANAFWLM
jgi:hypothetical protein